MAIEVLKFNSDPSVFAWKYPSTDLTTFTQLIVNESQEAIFVKSGQIADVFGPGKYTLSTQNIPVLQELVNLPFGKKPPFPAEVWFINRTFSLDIKWGTATPVQVQDPKYGVFIPLRAFGQFGIQIEDAKRFLTKLVGTMPFFNAQTMSDYFRGLYITRIKDSLSSCLVKSKISILEINAHLNTISADLAQQLDQEMAAYGIRIVSFYVNDISVPEDDPTVIQLKAALAKRAEMDILGYNYQQERTFETLNAAAGAAMSAGIGMGIGLSVGDIIGSAAGAPKAEDLARSCAVCGKPFSAGARFCLECGRKFRLCRGCGNDIPTDQGTCPICGQKICPDCGYPLTVDAKFCPECGAKV